MKRQNPEISVIIPIYNAEKTLNKCLNSVINQNYPYYEIILVDNNSNDSTKKIIQDFQKDNPQIKYIFEPKPGRGAARNAGIEISKGKIIAMTDSDCIVTKDWLEKITFPIRKNNEKVVQGSESEVISNFWSINMQKANEKFNQKSIDEQGYIQHVDTKNFAIKSDLLKELMFDEDIKNIEDFELGLRLRKISKIKFLDGVKLRHFHKTSLKKVFAVQFDRAYWAYVIFEKHKNDNNIRKELMFRSMSFFSYLYFPFWITIQFIGDWRKGFFLLVSNVAWALGTFWATLNKLFWKLK